MRLENFEWSVSGGTKLGHSHHFRQKNCQDAVAFTIKNDAVVGVVCDGCSEGHSSEVGAKLISHLICTELIDNVWLSKDCLFFKIQTAVEYFIQKNILINCNSKHHKELSTLFIKDFFLCTIIGFVITKKSGYIFSAGDGVYAINDELNVINQDDKPKYLAYNLIDPMQLTLDYNEWPIEFNIIEFDPSLVQKIMVASDGFTNHSLDKIQHSCETRGIQLPASLHGLQWGLKGQFGVSKWLNAKSSLGYFDDDCGLVIAEKIVQNAVSSC